MPRRSGSRTVPVRGTVSESACGAVLSTPFTIERHRPRGPFTRFRAHRVSASVDLRSSGRVTDSPLHRTRTLDSSVEASPGGSLVHASWSNRARDRNTMMEVNGQSNGSTTIADQSTTVAGQSDAHRRLLDPDPHLERDRGLTTHTVSLVIPVRNEARNIGWVLDQIPKRIDEVILIDGNSTDATLITARSCRPDITIVQQRGAGKGSALRTGFATASSDIIVMMDADGSMAPQEITHFLHFLENGYDFVKGSRFMGGGGSLDITRFRRLGNYGLLAFFNSLYRTDLTDLCYGFCAFHRRYLDLLDLEATGFEIEAEMTVRAVQAGLRIAEVPSLEMPRRTGHSNLNAVTDGRRVLRTVWRARHGKPASTTQPGHRVLTRSHDPSHPAAFWVTGDHDCHRHRHTETPDRGDDRSDEPGGSESLRPADQLTLRAPGSPSRRSDSRVRRMGPATRRLRHPATSPHRSRSTPRASIGRRDPLPAEVSQLRRRCARTSLPHNRTRPQCAHRPSRGVVPHPADRRGVGRRPRVASHELSTPVSATNRCGAQRRTQAVHCTASLRGPFV